MKTTPNRASSIGGKNLERAAFAGSSSAVLASLLRPIVTASDCVFWSKRDGGVYLSGTDGPAVRLACLETRRSHYLYFRARAKWHAADLDGLRQVYEHAMQPNPAAVPATLPFRALIAAMYWSAKRSHAKAEDAAREALRQEEAFVVTRAGCSARTMLAHILLARGQAEDAMEVFKPFLDETAESNLVGFLMRDSPFIVPLLRLQDAEWGAGRRSVYEPDLYL